MSLFDELVCLSPLPDGWDPQGAVFQTHDTPAQSLERYTLNPHGVLLEEATGAIIPFHGALAFSTGNGCAYGPWGVATSDDRPAWEAIYVALFDHGHLLRIEGARQDAPPTRPHIRRADWEAAAQAWRVAHPAPAPKPLPPTPAQTAALRAAIAHLLAVWQILPALPTTMQEACNALADAWRAAGGD